MSTDPYPEVGADESGIVPPQAGRAAEWPKKLRTLTAAELDRLTIDNSGRFYWDGKLVNYDTGTRQLSDKTSDALDLLDRASYELGGRKSPATIEGQLARPEPAARNDESSAVDLDVASAHEATVEDDVAAAVATHVIRTSDSTRLRLSGWQTLGAVIVVVAIAVGAFGMATYGYVAARDWGCKVGAFHDGCPVINARPPRVDIPA